MPLAKKVRRAKKGTPAIELRVPAWVPDQVAAKANKLHQANSNSPIAVALIKRLAGDLRMRRVWEELAKSNRQTGEPYHKLTEKFALLVDHNNAVAGLFEFAFNLGNLTAMLPQADNPDRPFQPRAKRLKDEASTLGRDPSSQIIAGQLLATATYCDGVTVAAYNPDEAMAVRIACWLESVFGSGKLRTTATITSVITGHEVTDRHVRNWLRKLRR